MAVAEQDSLRLVACPRERPTCLVTSGVLDSIGCTPLLLLRQASDETGCTIYAKAEYTNPGGSIKDRIAKHIILEAERRGELKPGATILEVTSGNTGIALAMVGAIRGYHVVIMMPETVSQTFQLCGPENLTWKQILTTIASAVGKTKLMLPAPALAVKGAAALLEGQSWFPITRDQIDMLLEGNVCDEPGAFRILGIEPIRFDELSLGYLNP